jgi:hypothetical protein
MNAQDKVQQEIMKRATGLFEQGKHLEALPDFRQLLSSSPEDVDLNFYYGTCLLSSDEDPDEAVKHLSFASKKRNVDQRVNYYLGQALHMDYRFSEAEKAYMKFMETADSKIQANFPETSRLISMSQNGKNLLNNIKDIKVISKTESTASDFFRSYDLSNVGGAVITVPEELLSSEDKKRGHRPLMHYDQSRPMCYFSSYGKGGDLNIYEAVRGSNGSFSKPVIVAGDVNTVFDEDYPFMHSDGRTLYFSSKGHNSMGGYDIFASVMDPSTGVFKRAENLDFAISSAEDDIFYVVDKARVWANFASNRNSQAGRLHVYQVKVSDSPLELALVSGRVKNELGGMSAARIKVVDAKTEQVLGTYQTDTNGDYLVDLPGMGKYKFYVEVTGSDLTHLGTVDVPSFGEIRAFKQEMSLVEVGGQEKLLIKNNFEEKVEGDVIAMAQEVLKRKAGLEVNSNAEELLALQDNTKTVLSEEELLVKSGFRKDTGMDAVMTLAYEQAEQVKKTMDDEEGERAMAAAVADVESSLAKGLADEATIAFRQYNSSTDPAEREELLIKAASYRSNSEQRNRKAEEALFLVDQLDRSIANKTATLLELNSRNDQLETKMLAADNEAVISILSEVKATDDKGITQLDVLDVASATAQDKRKESDRTLNRVEDIQEARDRTQASLKTKKNLLEKTSKSKDKNILEAEIQALDAELADYNTQLEKAAVRLEGIQTESDISAGALTLLERMRVGKDDELAGLPPLRRDKVDVNLLTAKVKAANEENKNINISRDELSMVMAKRPDLVKSYVKPEMLASYNIDEKSIPALASTTSTSNSNGATSTAINTNTTASAPKPAKPSTFVESAAIAELDPKYTAEKKKLDLSDDGDIVEWQQALNLNRSLEGKVKADLDELANDPTQKYSGRRAGLEDLYQKLQTESDELSARIITEETAMAEEFASNMEEVETAQTTTSETVPVSVVPSPIETINITLQGMDKPTVEEWMRNAAVADIEEISKSNAKLLEQGEPESLNSSLGLASRMEKHGSYIQMVNTLKASKQRTMANNPASASLIKKEVVAIDKIVAIKTEVMQKELREWEKLSGISLNDSERNKAIQNPQYLRERELLKKSDFTAEEQLAELKRINASQSTIAVEPTPQTPRETGTATPNEVVTPALQPTNTAANTTANATAVPTTQTENAETTASTATPTETAPAKVNTQALVTVNPTQAKTLAELDEIRANEKDVYQLETFLTDSKWTDELIQNPEARKEVLNSRTLIDEYLEARGSMNTQEKRYAQNVISMTLATPNSKEFKARELRLAKVNSQSKQLSKEAKELFVTADVLRTQATSESNLEKVNQNLREALFLELKALDLMNQAEEYEIHLVEGKQPETFEYSEAIVWNVVEETPADLATTTPERTVESPSNRIPETQNATEPVIEELALAENTAVETPKEILASPANRTPDPVTTQSPNQNTQVTQTPDQVNSTTAATPNNPVNSQLPSTTNQTTAQNVPVTTPAQTNTTANTAQNVPVTTTAVQPNANANTAQNVPTTTPDQVSTTANPTPDASQIENLAVESITNPISDVSIAEVPVVKAQANPSTTDEVLAPIRTMEDLQKLPVLNNSLALSTFPQASANLQTQNITAPTPLETKLASTPRITEAEVTVEPELAESLSAEELTLMKKNRVELLAVETQEKELNAEKQSYEKAAQERRVRLAEVIDIPLEQRTPAQQEEIQKLASETQVLNAYIQSSNESIASLEQKKTEIQKTEDRIITQTVEENLANATVTPNTTAIVNPTTTSNTPTSNSPASNTPTTNNAQPTTSNTTTSNPPSTTQPTPTPVVTTAVPTPAVKTSSSLAADWKIPTVLKENVFDMATTPKASVSSAPLAPAPVSALPSGLVYQVQVGAFRNAIPDDQFAEFRPVMTEGLSSGITRYTVGLFTTENVAVGARNQVRGLGYQDAFVVAYRDGKRVSLADARRPGANQNSNPSVAAATNTLLNPNTANTAQANPQNTGTQNNTAQTTGQNTGTQNNTAQTTTQNTGTQNTTSPANNAVTNPSNTAQNTNPSNPANTTASQNPNTTPRVTPASDTQLAEAISTEGLGTATKRVEDLTSTEKESASAYYKLVKGAAPANQVEVINGLFYTVQVGVYSKPVTSVAIFNLSPLNSELMENGQIKYTSGIFDSPEVALKWKDMVVQKGVGDAFVTAYLNGERITIATAQKILDEGGAAVTVNIDDLGELQRDREGQAVWEMVSTSTLFGEEVKDNVIFKIRMGPYFERIPDKDVKVILDFEDNVEYGRKADDTIIYTTKGAMTYEEAQEWRKTFLERGITNANIIAYKNGEEIPVKQALDFLLK